EHRIHAALSEAKAVHAEAVHALRDEEPSRDRAADEARSHGRRQVSKNRRLELVLRSFVAFANEREGLKIARRKATHALSHSDSSGECVACGAFATPASRGATHGSCHLGLPDSRPALRSRSA